MTHPTLTRQLNLEKLMVKKFQWAVCVHVCLCMCEQSTNHISLENRPRYYAKSTTVQDAFRCVCACACVCEHVYVCVCTVHVRMCIHMHVCVCMCVVEIWRLIHVSAFKQGVVIVKKHLNCMDCCPLIPIQSTNQLRTRKK